MKKLLSFLLILSLLCLSACTPGGQESGESTSQAESEFSYDVTTLPKSATAVTNGDVFGQYLDPSATNTVMVILTTFTDGHEVDRAAFEDAFCGEYGPDECMKSVSAYYKQQSYGRELFDFRFFYYDSGMSCEEAWHYVNDEDEHGFFRGNDYLYEVYDAVKAGNPEAVDAMDGDRDGYIDACIFMFGEHPVDECYIFGAASGTMSASADEAVVGDPTFRHYIKMSYDFMTEPMFGPGASGGTRVLLHECGHLFGISDYYDFYGDEDGNIIDALGLFDMHVDDAGDENVFSKFSCGWLHPYVITPEMDGVILSIRSSSLYDETILIPSIRGWNGTAFDEYILIDVLAPRGASGEDWARIEDIDERSEDPGTNPAGGVRIRHVDARLMCGEYDYELNRVIWTAVEDPTALAESSQTISFRHYNTNGLEPEIEGDTRFMHIIDTIPVSGEDIFRISQPTGWSAFHIFGTRDLFSAGDSFSMERCADAFPNGRFFNSGALMDYEVQVLSYNPETTEALIYITKVEWPER